MKDLLLKQYKIKVNGIDFDLHFLDNLTLIKGYSGLGKTMLFKAIEKDAMISKNNILCLNYDDINSGNIKYTLENVKGKIIFIDNADITLTIEQRCKVSMDSDNQYIIFTHNTHGYNPNKNSITRLVVNGKRGYLNHFLVRQ